jgi:hypothetical protein
VATAIITNMKRENQKELILTPAYIPDTDV